MENMEETQVEQRKEMENTKKYNKNEELMNKTF